MESTKVSQIVKISTPYITLCQLLKFAHLVPSGAMVKKYLEENDILLNGLQEKRRGKKLYGGDVVLINNHIELKIS